MPHFPSKGQKLETGYILSATLGFIIIHNKWTSNLEFSSLALDLLMAPLSLLSCFPLPLLLHFFLRTFFSLLLQLACKTAWLLMWLGPMVDQEESKVSGPGTSFQYHKTQRTPWPFQNQFTLYSSSSPVCVSCQRSLSCLSVGLHACLFFNAEDLWGQLKSRNFVWWRNELCGNF